MPTKGYVLSTRDRLIIKDLIRNWEQQQNARPGINPNEQQQTKSIWARVKTGTRITALREVGGTLEPGEGECILWRDGWEINAGNPQPVLTKINSQGSLEGQDTANEADDETITVYNYTPYELFECTWLQVALSRQGRWEVANPPLPIYFARNQTEVVNAGQVGTFQLGHFNYEEVATGNTPAIQWITGNVTNVVAALNTVGANEIVIVAQEPGGKFVVVEQSSSTSIERVRYRLIADFGNTGITTAEVLDVISGNSAGIGDVITVYDVKKQFGDTRTDSVGLASKFRIDDGSGTPENEVWQIETSDQVVNKIKGTILSSLDGNDPTETVAVTFDHNESYWPYVLDEVLVEGQVTAVNLNMFTANAGAVYIERRIENSLTDDESNTTAPYSHAGGASKWIITEVEKPTARWTMCKWDGSNWSLSVGDGFWEGYSPAAHDTLSVSIPKAFVDEPCELNDDERGIAFLSNRGSGVGTLPKYIVVATKSSLYGEGKQVDLVADLLEHPMAASDIVYEDGCDLKYRKVAKAIVFGNLGGGECLMEATDETAPPLNQDTLTVVKSVTQSVDPTTGEIKLTLERSSIQTCLDTPLGDVDVSILTPVESNLLTDIACVGNEVTQSYETIKHLGTTNTGSNTVDLSCIVNDIDWTSVYIDYNNIINYPDVYVDYYHILWPDGCEPCDPPPPEGCCTITYDSGSTEERTSSHAWCTAKGNEEGITSTSWTAGPCGQDPTGCCEDQPGGVPDSMMTESDCTAAGGTWAGAGVECSGSGGCEGTIISNFQIGGAASAGGGCTAQFVQGANATVTGGVATINGTWSGNTNFMTPYNQPGTITMTHDGTNWNWTGTHPVDGSVFSGSCAAPCQTGCGGSGSATDGSICTGWQYVTFAFNAS